MGNIYANEVLFTSRLSPFKKGKEITKEECQKIINATNDIIPKAIKMGGTTIKSYTSSLGVSGRFQHYLQVHKRDGQKCPYCKEIISKEKIGGRSTYFCHKCQH